MSTTEPRARHDLYKGRYVICEGCGKRRLRSQITGEWFQTGTSRYPGARRYHGVWLKVKHRIAWWCSDTCLQKKERTDAQ